MSSNPPTDNYFKLFGLTPSFEVDATELSERYRELQRRVHPDRFASASDAERRLSLQRTTQANDAFQTLKDPLRRARYLLMLSGIDTDDETDTVMDPGFLIEQMDLRERLEQARATEGTARAHRLDEMGRVLRDQLYQKTEEFRHAIGADLLRARGAVREMQFLRKLLDEVVSSAEEIA